MRINDFKNYFPNLLNTPFLSESVISDLISSLERQGWFSAENIFPEAPLFLLTCKDLYTSGDYFSEAMIGKNLNQVREPSIRKSEIFWLEQNDTQLSPYVDPLFRSFDALKNILNESFFLSLKRWESQFALYRKGGFYKKHLDQFKNNRHRQITLILYLNDCPEGGELVLYNRDQKNIKDFIIKPKQGSMVIFFSNQIYHEVLPVTHPRYSITTWFRDDLEVFL